MLKIQFCHFSYHEGWCAAEMSTTDRKLSLWSAQVSDDQEHEDAGQQHASDHDELILGRSPFYQPHHCVRQPQHVGHVQHLLVGPLCGAETDVNSEDHVWDEAATTMTTQAVLESSDITWLYLSKLIHLILKDVKCQRPRWRATPSEVSHGQTTGQTHPDKRRPEAKPGRPSPPWKQGLTLSLSICTLTIRLLWSMWTQRLGHGIKM